MLFRGYYPQEDYRVSSGCHRDCRPCCVNCRDYFRTGGFDTRHAEPPRIRLGGLVATRLSYLDDRWRSPSNARNEISRDRSQKTVRRQTWSWSCVDTDDFVLRHDQLDNMANTLGHTIQ